MARATLRAVARLRRALLELHALPPGSLPDEWENLIADVVAPGFRERVLTSYLAGLASGGADAVAGTRLAQGGEGKPLLL
jgi:hypothetical protein